MKLGSLERIAEITLEDSPLNSICSNFSFVAKRIAALATKAFTSTGVDGRWNFCAIVVRALPLKSMITTPTPTVENSLKTAPSIKFIFQTPSGGGDHRELNLGIVRFVGLKW